MTEDEVTLCAMRALVGVGGIPEKMAKNVPMSVSGEGSVVNASSGHSNGMSMMSGDKAH